MRRVALLVPAVSALSEPSYAETIRLEVIFAARAREASMLPMISVAPFEGPHGDELGQEFERRLERLGEDGLPHAKLIAPSLRPDGLLTGRTDVSVQEQPYIENRSRCVARD